MRDANPTVVLVPGVGMFSFGKNKTEARITGEFYTNAMHVMEGATALWIRRSVPAVLPQAGPAAKTEAFSVHSNYVALPPSEAFRIEYWALEEAKIRRQPPEKELSRQVRRRCGRRQTESGARRLLLAEPARRACGGGRQGFRGSESWSRTKRARSAARRRRSR